MKKIILLAAVTVFGIATTNAQTAKKAVKKETPATLTVAPKVDGAGLVFESETIDYGTIAKGSEGKRPRCA